MTTEEAIKIYGSNPSAGVRAMLGGEGEFPMPPPPVKKPCTPIPRKEWNPLIANFVDANAIDADKGLGDTIYRMVGSDESAVFCSTFKSITGHDCGCPARREALNILYRYNEN